MTCDIQRLKARRDALLDEIELLNIMIYEHQLALERLNKESYCADDDDAKEVTEY
jgi:hypothetical protein